jgi:hypothetical protein
MSSDVETYIGGAVAIGIMYIVLSFMSSLFVSIGGLCDANTVYTHVVYSKMFCQLK